MKGSILAKTLMNRLSEFLAHTYRTLETNPTELVDLTLDQFIHFHQSQPASVLDDFPSPHFSPVKVKSVELPNNETDLANKSTVEFVPDKIRTQSANTSEKLDQCVATENRQSDINHTSQESRSESSNAKQHIKSEPFSQSSWSQDVEILEPNSTEIICIEDVAETTQDLIDNLMTPGMGHMASEAPDLLHNLVPTQSTIDSAHSPLESPPSCLELNVVNPTHIVSAEDIPTQSEALATSVNDVEDVYLLIESEEVVASAKTNKKQQYFENPLEKTQIIKHTFAPLEVAIENVPARIQTARRGRKISAGADRFVTKRRYVRPVENEFNIEDASICMNSTVDQPQPVEPISSPQQTDQIVYDESQRCQLSHRIRPDRLLPKVSNTSNITESTEQFSNNRITIPLDHLSITSSISALTTDIFQPSLINKYFLKLAHMVEATFTSNGGSQICLSVRFAHQHITENLNAESSRLLLQMSSANQWYALCALSNQMTSVTFTSNDTRAKTMRRSLIEQVLCLVAKSRNFVREGLVIMQNPLTRESRVARFVGLSTPATCMDNAVCPEILEKLKLQRQALH